MSLEKFVEHLDATLEKIISKLENLEVRVSDLEERSNTGHTTIQTPKIESIS